MNKIQQFFSNIQEKVKPATLCFFSGDLFATSFYLLWGGAVTDFFAKAGAAFVIGLIGGFAGLAGKDLYPLLKMALKKLFKTAFKKQQPKQS